MLNQGIRQGPKRYGFYMASVIQLCCMINHNTANLKEVLGELKILKVEILKKIEDIYKNYKKEFEKKISPKTIKSQSSEEEPYSEIRRHLDHLYWLERYYKSNSFKHLLKDSEDIITIIDKLISEPIIKKITVNQLKRMVETKRMDFLGKFEDDFIEITKYDSPNSIYKNSCDLDKFIKDFIKITINLDDSIGENNPLKDISKKNKINIDLGLPEKIEWDKVTIKIKDGLKDIEILYDGKFKRLVSFDEIGFSSSKKNVKENRQWELLKIFSILLIENNKLATPNHLSVMLSNQANKKITIANLYKIKKSLSDSLKSLFKTEEDPFLDYNDRGYYEIKFKLLPQPELRNKGEIWSNPSGYNDNIDSNSDYDSDSDFDEDDDIDKEY